MKDQDSVYLYADDRREDYLKAFQQKKCPHEFKVLSYLDLETSRKENKETFFETHLQKCECCTEKAVQVLEHFKRLEKLIPEVPLAARVEDELKRFHFTCVKGTRWDISLENRVRQFVVKRLRPMAADLLQVIQEPKVLVISLLGIALAYWSL